MEMVIMRDHITISEVGPRDGLQNCKGVMPTDLKKRWITALYEAGIREIEVGSFVPPKLFPQLADTAEMVAHAKTLSGLRVLALVPNLRGAQGAIAAGVDAMGFPLSVSETHSRKNLRQTHDQAVENVRQIAGLIAEQPEHSRPSFEGALSTAFGCSIEGVIKEKAVLRLAERLVEAGVDELGLSDTVGYANPVQVKRLIRRTRDVAGADRVKSVHLHNTYGQGLANAFAAWEEGIETFDSSLGGLGGCPASPGASGNIVTEDMVQMFHAMGVETGVDMDKLIATRAFLEEGLPGEAIYGFTPNAGLPKHMVA
ncbi:hydroxymethylglutaryl-CoA lyase [Algimonas porphyrae]|uniref:Hydroxymethylglutaryl-CoA lyase n=2 Tax=Algimonas porphyrae TaxID=1128113 RepID=A0ABQ5UZM1_9PROT|nr:hydroxymethylglutaryl-CoA lyase [Algimonas porphyrae]